MAAGRRWRSEVAVKPNPLWLLLHLFFAFSYVGSLVVAEWNGRAARATEDWSQRALLFQVSYLSARVAGLGSLLLTGVIGHILSFGEGLRMASDPWMWWVTGLWAAAVLGMLFLTLPNAGRLASISRLAAGGGGSEGYSSALARWRIGGVLQSALYLGLLVLMVYRRRP